MLMGYLKAKHPKFTNDDVRETLDQALIKSNMPPLGAEDIQLFHEMDAELSIALAGLGANRKLIRGNMK